MACRHMKIIKMDSLSRCAVVLAAWAVACSCYSYEVRTVKRPLVDSADQGLFSALSASGESLYDWKPKSAAAETAAVRKYYAVMSGSGPVAEMNNRAVMLAVGEQFYEAEIILRQALEETETEPALYNNLGIVCEMTGNSKQASVFYLRACLLDDKDRRIRSNFLGLHETSGK